MPKDRYEVDTTRRMQGTGKTKEDVETDVSRRPEECRCPMGRCGERGHRLYVGGHLLPNVPSTALDNDVQEMPSVFRPPAPSRTEDPLFPPPASVPPAPPRPFDTSDPPSAIQLIWVPSSLRLPIGQALTCLHLQLHLALPSPQLCLHPQSHQLSLCPQDSRLHLGHQDHRLHVSSSAPSGSPSLVASLVVLRVLSASKSTPT
ncbi:hypothetical protein DPX16_9063 [Anabarilius grahami]|uniref:Uncharacterized protein n=1 Tax=Anabarilius grahami TaxID=495550 RepID=A0A3N0YKM0_ANAGA|nr:hypothetical protein DPX16_9063 [Anabarilius grahami]